MNNNRRIERKAKRGAVLIAVLVCLTVIMLMIGVLAARVVLVRNQLRREAAFQQASWLCESGLRRALAGLENDATYNGTTWKVEADELGGESTAEVSISVDSADGASKDIRVIAVYPLGEQCEMRCSRTVAWSPNEQLPNRQRGE